MATKQIQKSPTSAAIRTYPHLDYSKLLEAGNYRAICLQQSAPVPTLEFSADIETDAASRMQYLIQKLPSTTGISCEQAAIRFNILAGIIVAQSYGDCIGYYYDEHFDAQAIGADLKPARPYFEHMQAKTGLSVIDEYIITINTKSALAALRAISYVHHEENSLVAESRLALNMLPYLEIHVRNYFSNNVKIVAGESSIILTKRRNLFTNMNDYTYLIKRIETHAVETKSNRAHTYGVTNCIANAYPLVYVCSENYDKYAPNIRAIICNRETNRSTKSAPEVPFMLFNSQPALRPIATTADISEIPPSPLAPFPTQLKNSAPKVLLGNCATQYTDASPITALSYCDELSLALTSVYSYTLTLLIAHPFDLATNKEVAIVAFLTEIDRKIQQIKTHNIQKLVYELFNVAIFDEYAILPQHFVRVCRNRPCTAMASASNYYTQTEYYDRAIDVVESFFYTFKAIKFYLHDIRAAFDEVAKLIMEARLLRYCEFAGPLAAIGAVFGAYYGFAELATLPAHNLNNEFTRFMLYNSPQSAQVKKSKFKSAPLRPSAISPRVPDNDAESKYVVNYQNMYEIFHGIIAR